MGTSNYGNDFKRYAVHQITVRGYSVREFSRRLGVSTHSLYNWMKLFAEPSIKPGELQLQKASQCLHLKPQ